MNRRKLPWASLILLGLMLLGCLFAELIMTREPGYLDLSHTACPPGRDFYFGTDALGRDLFSCIWYGGRISLTVGFLAAAVSTVTALIYGSASALAPTKVGNGMMRLAELMLSIPSLLLVLFIQAMLGKATVLSIALVLGLTGWAPMAKVIRTEVTRVQEAEFVTAARAMGVGRFRLLAVYFAPNCLPAVMFMIVMNIRGAIAAEATLSFLGMGLPLEVISWGSLLSLANQALLTGSWWVILIPGGFLLTAMLCITAIGNWLRGENNRKARLL